MRKDLAKILDNVSAAPVRPGDGSLIYSSPGVFVAERELPRTGQTRIDILMSGRQNSVPSSLRSDEKEFPPEFKMRRYYRDRKTLIWSPTSNGIDVSREALEGLTSKKALLDENFSAGEIFKKVLTENLSKVENIGLKEGSSFRAKTPKGLVTGVVRRNSSQRIDDLSLEQDQRDARGRDLMDSVSPKRKDDDAR